MKPRTYAEAGVDIDAGDAFTHFISQHPSAAVSKAIGGFAGGVEIDLRRWEEPVLFSTTDGVGTKLLVARELAQFDTIGIDLVAMCVNDLVVTGATPIQFLDYIALGRIVPGFLESVIKGVVAGCEQAECTLAGGETAEMPDVYGEDDFDLAGFAVGIAEKCQVRPFKDKILPGSILIGLPSNGIHSNGFSLARKVLPKESGWWPELLKPTRIYVKELKALFGDSGFLAAAHITGGGLAGNLQRVLPEGLKPRFSRQWRVPEVFGAIRKKGIPQEELERVFNMGVGMVLVLAPQEVVSITQTLTEHGLPWFEAGDLS